jgi:plastocyanin
MRTLLFGFLIPAAVLGGLLAVPVAAQAPGQVVDLGVYDNVFQAPQITVPAGTTVVWTNTGRNYHTVTSDQGIFNSGVMAYGDWFFYTFTEPGNYPYHCNYHRREMRGVIYVR